MQAGTLNRRITIQKEGTIYDELGEPIPGGWVTYAIAWADIRHLSGLQTVKSNIDVSIVKASIRVRYVTGITAAMRILHGATVYSIDAVMPDAQHKEFTDLICTTGAAT
ncbi:phage head closure protein [Eoetvoesiella caeni]